MITNAYLGNGQGVVQYLCDSCPPLDPDSGVWYVKYTLTGKVPRPPRDWTFEGRTPAGSWLVACPKCVKKRYKKSEADEQQELAKLFRRHVKD